MSGPVHVMIETALGDVELAVDVERAPLTARNFLRYVDDGLYSGGTWHRTVLPDNQPDNDIRIEVIQGGLNPERAGDIRPPIPLERTTVTGLRHIDGTVSMGRFAPDSAHSEIFICVGDQPSLDFGGMRNPDGQGFAAFGQVTRGMDVVRAIQRSPHDGQRLTPPIVMRRVGRLAVSD
ncbi:MAG TPA: peptidylprolyl isomerase [Thermomicrobiales bacterium]|nr:peptidylprolyl isomerase [Thermomicrobiales bacterium]